MAPNFRPPTTIITNSLITSRGRVQEAKPTTFQLPFTMRALATFLFPW
jgi:hypothetical protein